MKVHDVAITADSQRLLCVATLLSSADGLQPSLSRAEKRIIGEEVLPIYWNAMTPRTKYFIRNSV